MAKIKNKKKGLIVSLCIINCYTAEKIVFFMPQSYFLSNKALQYDHRILKHIFS